jgi:AT hook motif
MSDNKAQPDNKQQEDDNDLKYGTPEYAHAYYLAHRKEIAVKSHERYIERSKDRVKYRRQTTLDKHPELMAEIEAKKAIVDAAAAIKPKRGRGRPRKEKPVDPAPKKPRGRPRKAIPAYPDVVLPEDTKKKIEEDIKAKQEAARAAAKEAKRERLHRTPSQNAFI